MLALERHTALQQVGVCWLHSHVSGRAHAAPIESEVVQGGPGTAWHFVSRCSACLARNFVRASISLPHGKLPRLALALFGARLPRYATGVVLSVLCILRRRRRRLVLGRGSESRRCSRNAAGAPPAPRCWTRSAGAAPCSGLPTPVPVDEAYSLCTHGAHRAVCATTVGILRQKTVV